MKPGYGAVVSGLWFPFKISLNLLFYFSNCETVRYLLMGTRKDSSCLYFSFFLITSFVGVRLSKNTAKKKFCGGVRSSEHPCHVGSQKSTLNTCDVCVLHHPVQWERGGLVFFPPLCAQNKIAETSRHYLAKSRPNICDVYWHIDYPWRLLAEGVRRVGRVRRSAGARWDPGSIMHTKRMRLSIYWVFMLRNRKCGAPLLKLTDC